MKRQVLSLLAVLLAAETAAGALAYYELRLTTDADYAGFGGGSAGEVRTGIFGFDAALMATNGPVFQSTLSSSSFFFNFNLEGTLFTTINAVGPLDNGLFFEGGMLHDVFFNITTPTGENIRVATVEGIESDWVATDAGGDTMGGSMVSVSVQWSVIPEPGMPALGAAVALLLLGRRIRR